jgi:pilus assembly protein Flp/PilA
MNWIGSVFRSFATAENGATMVEYGFMLFFIALVVAVAAATLGTSVAAVFTGVNATFAP